MVFTDYLQMDVTVLDAKIKDTYKRSAQFNNNLYPSYSAPNLLQLNEEVKERNENGFLPPLNVTNGSNNALFNLHENMNGYNNGSYKPQKKMEYSESHDSDEEEDEEQNSDQESDDESESCDQRSHRSQRSQVNSDPGSERNIATVGLMNDMRKEMHYRGGQYSHRLSNKHKYDHMFPDLAGMKTPPRKPKQKQRMPTEEELKAKRDQEEFLKIKNEILQEFYKKPNRDRDENQNQMQSQMQSQIQNENIQVMKIEQKKSPRSILSEYKRLQSEVKAEKEFSDTQSLYQTGLLSGNNQTKQEKQESFRFDSNLDLDNESDQRSVHSNHESQYSAGVHSNHESQYSAGEEQQNRYQPPKSVYTRPPTSYVPASRHNPQPPQQQNQMYSQPPKSMYESPLEYNKFKPEQPSYSSYQATNYTVGGTQQYLSNNKPYSSNIYGNYSASDQYATNGESQQPKEDEREPSPSPSNQSSTRSGPTPEQFSSRIDEIINNVTKGVEESEKQQDRDRRKVEQMQPSDNDEKPKNGYARIAANKKQYKNPKPLRKRTDSNESKSSNGNPQLTKPNFWQHDSNKGAHFPYPLTNSNEDSRQSTAYNYSNSYSNQQQQTTPYITPYPPSVDNYRDNENNSEIPPSTGKSSLSNGLSTYPPHTQDKPARENSGTSGYNTVEGSESESRSGSARSRSKSVPSKDGYMAGYNMPDFNSEEHKQRDSIYSQKPKSLQRHDSVFSTYTAPRSATDLMEQIESMKQRHREDVQAIEEMKLRPTTQTSS